MRGKTLLNIVEMQRENFKSFSAFLIGPLVKRIIDTKGETDNWLKIVRLRYNKNFGII